MLKRYRHKDITIYFVKVCNYFEQLITSPEPGDGSDKDCKFQ